MYFDNNNKMQMKMK